MYYKINWPEGKEKLYNDIKFAVVGGANFHTHEMLSPVTRFIVDITLTKGTEDHLVMRSEQEKVIREEIIPKELALVQNAVASLLNYDEESKEKDLLECYLLKEAEPHFRLLWPNLFVEKEKGKEIVDALGKQLNDSSLTGFTITEAIYTKGCTPVLGATSLHPLPSGQPGSPLKLMAIYNKEGTEIVEGGQRKKVNLTVLNTLWNTTTFNPDGWKPSNWK